MMMMAETLLRRENSAGNELWVFLGRKIRMAQYTCTLLRELIFVQGIEYVVYVIIAVDFRGGRVDL